MLPWPAIAAAACAAVWLSFAGLSHGGLAELVVAAAAGAVVGLPLASLAQSAPERALRTELVRVAGAVIALACLGGALEATALSLPLRAGFALSVWWLACLLGPRPWTLAAPIVLLAVGAVGMAGIGHWTLLEVHWSGLGDWWSRSAALGLLLAGTGGLAWSRTEAGRRPYLGFGLGLWAALGMALLLGLAWEGGMVLAPAAAVGLGGVAVLGSTEGLRTRPYVVGGGVLAVALALGGTEVSGVLLATLAPVLIAAVAASLAFDLRGSSRFAAVALAAGCAAIGLSNGFALPDAVLPAVGAALAVVAVVWAVGTRFVLERRGA